MKKTIIALAFIASATLANAHEGAEGVVKERMDAMSAIGKANKPLVAMIRGRTDVDLTVVKDSANIIAENAGEHFSSLFPEGSIGAPSEALPAIWEDWERFSNLSLELETAAMALADITDEAEFADLFKAVGGTCRSCHSDYRE